MLDRFMPNPRLVEIDEVDLAAPPARVYDLVRHWDLARSPVVRALFALRTLPDRLTGHATEPPKLSMDDIGSQRPGFRIVADEPRNGFAAAAIGRFWELEIPFVDFEPATFASFDEPGFAKVAWAFRTKPLGKSGTRLAMEVRVDATDDDAWKKVRRYFRLIGPFSRFIRRHELAQIARELGELDGKREHDPLPGDDLMSAARVQRTDAVVIHAPPERIWPWLVQMGCGRAGWYSYDWLDNGGRPSAREIVPELQELAVGDVLPATVKGSDGFEVLSIDAQRALALGGLYDLDRKQQLPFVADEPERLWRVTWAFVLEPLEADLTLLRVRARLDFAPPSARARAAWMGFLHGIMQAKQLENVKARAEGRPIDTPKDVAQGIAGAFGMLLDLATPFLRSARSHWGLERALAERPHPGDDLVPDPLWSWTHAIEIDAPAEEVWPWVAQLGRNKAGFYSLQWLENLAGCEIQNADRVHPEWQDPKPGDLLELHPNVALPIVRVEPGSFLLAHAGESENGPSFSWLFEVEPLADGRSRVLSRARSHYERTAKNRVLFGPYFTESIGFVMDRTMLEGIRDRAQKRSPI